MPPHTKKSNGQHHPKQGWNRKASWPGRIQRCFGEEGASPGHSLDLCLIGGDCVAQIGAGWPPDEAFWPSPRPASLQASTPTLSRPRNAHSRPWPGSHRLWPSLQRQSRSERADSGGCPVPLCHRSSQNVALPSSMGMMGSLGGPPELSAENAFWSIGDRFGHHTDIARRFVSSRSALHPLSSDTPHDGICLTYQRLRNLGRESTGFPLEARRLAQVPP